jgi:hypothetical protein
VGGGRGRARKLGQHCAEWQKAKNEMEIVFFFSFSSFSKEF